MTITLDVPATVAARINHNDADRKRAEEMIAQAFAEKPIETETPQDSTDDWLTRFNEACKTFTAITKSHGAKPLSDYDVSRESMYNEHERHM